MHLMTVEASNLPVIHIALNKIVPLHPVLVRSQIGVLKEVRHARLQLLKPPEINQPLPGQKTHRPVEVLPFNRIRQRTPLAMALDASIVPSHIVETIWIDDITPSWMRDMQTARPMALLAAYIPLRHMLGLNVIVHRMTPITGRPGRPVKITRAIKRQPPVRSRLRVIRQPSTLLHVPLRRQRIVVVPALRKKSLLPPAPIHKRNIIEPEGDERIRMSKIRKHSLRMLLRIAHNICHPSLFPSLVRCRVASLAALRSNKVSRRSLRLRPTTKRSCKEKSNKDQREYDPHPLTVSQCCSSRAVHAFYYRQTPSGNCHLSVTLHPGLCNRNLRATHKRSRKHRQITLTAYR